MVHIKLDIGQSSMKNNLMEVFQNLFNKYIFFITDKNGLLDFRSPMKNLQSEQLIYKFFKTYSLFVKVVL